MQRLNKKVLTLVLKELKQAVVLKNQPADYSKVWAK